VGSQIVQSWDAPVNNVSEEIYETAGERGFHVDQDNFGGAFFFMFHFQ